MTEKVSSFSAIEGVALAKVVTLVKIQFNTTLRGAGSRGYFFR